MLKELKLLANGVNQGGCCLKIQFCGAAGTVTGSCFLVTTDSAKFLLDCGMFQGSRALKERNYGDFPFNPEEIDFVILSHAHVDHAGLLPKLYKKGFKGWTYATKVTRELCAIVLPDSGYIQEMEVERKNRKLMRKGEPLLTPIYTAQDARDCLKYFKSAEYEEAFEPAPGIKVVFQDAGHILGSAITELFIEENGRSTKIVFTGDLGNTDQPIVEERTNIDEANVVIMESTYGNRYHLETENRDDTLARIVNRTLKKGGNLVIPSFAVERTQELIYNMRKLQTEGRIPVVDIYIDSPMAIEATKVFVANTKYYDQEAQEIVNNGGVEAIFSGPNIHYVLTPEESMMVNRIKSGAIIISASGMADAGRIKHHLKHNLWRKESTVLFVGYQAEGTLGRRILDGEKKVRIHGEEIAVKADIEIIDGFSSHADQSGLLDWLSNFKTKPELVFLVHGEEFALETLQRLIITELGIKTEIASLGEVYDLTKGFAELPAEEMEYAQASNKENVLEALNRLKSMVQEMAKAPDRDVRGLQRILANLYEIERNIERMA